MTVDADAIDRTPDKYSKFLQINKTMGKLYLNHSLYNCTDVLVKGKYPSRRQCEGYEKNVSMPMWLRATTLGNKTVARKVVVNFNYPWTNTAPRIEGVKKKLVVKVKEEDIVEKRLSNRYASYTSRKAFDREKDKPIMSIKGNDLPCKCLTFQQRKDNTFKLELDKTKLTKKDAGAHALYITVKD